MTKIIIHIEDWKKIDLREKNKQNFSEVVNQNKINKV